MALLTVPLNWISHIGISLLALASLSYALPALEGKSYASSENVTLAGLPASNLLKRALTPGQTLSVYQQASTLKVSTDDAQYLDCSTGPYPKYIGTSGLNGCTGIAVCSNQGCGLIHVLPDEQATANYKWRALIQQTFTAHPDLKGSSAVLGAYMKPSGIWYDWEVQQIQSLLQNSYQVPSTVEGYWEYYGDEEEFKELFDGDGDEIPETVPQNFVENEAMGLMLVQCTSATEHEVYVAGVQHT